jgi:hypothetical protein
LHARVPINDFEAAVMELLVVARPAQGSRPTEDGVERRAQFVRNRGDELVI